MTSNQITPSFIGVHKPSLNSHTIIGAFIEDKFVPLVECINASDDLLFRMTKAYNTHDDLVAALDWCVNEIERHQQANGIKHPQQKDGLDKAKQALAKAGAE